MNGVSQLMSLAAVSSDTALVLFHSLPLRSMEICCKIFIDSKILAMILARDRATSVGQFRLTS